METEGCCARMNKGHRNASKQSFDFIFCSDLGPSPALHPPPTPPLKVEVNTGRGDDHEQENGCDY